MRKKHRKTPAYISQQHVARHTITVNVASSMSYVAVTVIKNRWIYSTR